MAIQDDITTTLGFPPNTREVADVHKITSSAMAQAAVRAWLQKQGIPYKAARSAIPNSLALSYTNSNYLNKWRTAINPQWALLGGDDDAMTVAEPPTVKQELATTTAMTSQQNEEWLKSLFAQIDKTVRVLVDDKIANTKLQLDDSAKQLIRTIAETAATAAIEANSKPRTIEIHEVATGEFRSLGLQHERFPTLLKATQARDHRGFRLNIWLTGPTGSGKTTAAENCAKALSLPFGSDGSLDADYKVLGFRDANGNVISTQFLDIYEKGGIYVADEIDNWLPSALLSLNAALANGWCSSPRGLIQRHPDACVIACANTWGLGATSDYVGRTKLDAASLDRFQPKIDWPVDEKLERALAESSGGQMGLDWHDIVLGARKRAKEQGLKVIISPRGTFGGIALMKAGFEQNEAIAMTLAAGLSPEQTKAIGLDKPFGTSVKTGLAGEQEVHRLLRNGDRLEAIKLYREIHNTGLYEAKLAIENIESDWRAEKRRA